MNRYRDEIMRGMPAIMLVLIFTLYVVQVAAVVVFGPTWPSLVPILATVCVAIAGPVVWFRLARQEQREWEEDERRFRESWRQMIDEDFPALDRITSRRSIYRTITGS